MSLPAVPLAIAASLLSPDLVTAAEDDPTRSWWWLGAALCFGAALFGSVASTSLLLYSPAKLGRVLNGSAETHLARLQDHRTAYHVLSRSLAIGGTIGSALLVWAAAVPATRWWAVTVYTVLTMVACGVLPGAIASCQAERVVAATHRPLELLRRVLHFPVVAPLVAIGNLVLRLLRLPQRANDPEKIVEDILAAVEDNVAEAGLAADERGWIENIVDLKELHASEVMTPRTDMVAFDRELPLVDAVVEATKAGYSRFPVYEDRVDHVVGVFYAKDVLPLLGAAAPDRTARVADYMRKPLFVPESIGLVDLLRQFRTSRVQMAIVLDEYGGTAGLVTIEDVLEEIVGDITDEYDPDEEPWIDVIEAGRVIETSGRVRIEEINEALAVDIPEGEDYDTVAGFVFTSLDRIPKVHETVEIAGIEFEVLEADERRIHRLRLSLPAARPTV